MESLGLGLPTPLRLLAESFTVSFKTLPLSQTATTLSQLNFVIHGVTALRAPLLPSPKHFPPLHLAWVSNSAQMVVDEDKNLEVFLCEPYKLESNAIERIYQSLLIPLASRIYAFGMGRREVDLKAASNSRRSNDTAFSLKEWKKYKYLGR
jgi:hypothetical protein